MASDAPTVGQQLQQWRLRRGLSLGALSLRCGIHKSTLSRWERGIQLPSTRELDDTLKALEVSAQERAACWQQLDAPRAVLYRHQEPAGMRQISGGELLRALRLRSGVTQQDAARAAGVTREMLSRWERGERWPDGQKLHALCYALGASLDETLHLTTRGFIEQEPLPLERPALLQIHLALAYDTTSPKLELANWHIAARFAELDRGDPFRLQLIQAAIWGTLGYNLWHQGNLGSASRLGQQTMRLMQDCRGFLGASQLRGILVQAEVESRQSGPLAAVRFLESWLGLVTIIHLRAWVYSIQADYLLRAGEITSALQRSDAARKLISNESNDPKEGAYRHRDYARHLLLAKEPRRALEVLQSLQDSSALPKQESGPTCFLFAKALYAVGEVGEALTYREQAMESLARHRLSLPPEYQSL
nr:helix-turn-helix transcriptional regulator [Armatimonas rosea]